MKKIFILLLTTVICSVFMLDTNVRGYYDDCYDPINKALRGCITIDPDKQYNVAILGDSYSAGNGAGMYYHHKGSYRSHRNWSNLYIN